MKLYIHYKMSKLLMKKKLSIILNVVFIVFIMIGIIWYILNPVQYNSPVQDSIKKDTITTIIKSEEKQVQWESLAAIFAGLITFGVKLYFDRKDKNSQYINIDHTNNDHPIFSTIHELQINELRNLNLGAPGRTQVFKLMIQEQLIAYETSVRKFIGLQFNDAADFREKARLMILESIQNYEQKWKDLGIPELVVTRYTLLQKDKTNLLLSDIDTLVCYRITDTMTDFSEVTFYLLTYLYIHLRLFLTSDAIQTLKELNGTLKTVTFNGQPL